MVQDIKIWILLGIVSICGVIIGFVGKQWYNMIAAKMDKIFDVLSDIKQALVSHEKDIEYIISRQDEMHGTLTEHGKRLGDLERHITKNN